MLRTKYHSSGASIPLRPWSATPQGVFFDLSSDCLSLFLFPWMHILDRAGKQTGKSKVAWFADQILFKPWLNKYIYIYLFTGFDRCPKWGNNIIQSHPKSWRHQGFWGTSIPDIISWAAAAARAEQKARVAWPKPRAPRAWIEEPIANGWASINKNITGLRYKMRDALRGYPRQHTSE